MKKLKEPKWLNITYFVLALALPLVYGIITIAMSKPSFTRSMLLVFVIALLLWIVIKKFVLGKMSENLNKKIVLIQHDYDYDVGNKKKLKQDWFKYSLVSYAYNAITLFLCIWISLFVIRGAANGLLALADHIMIVFGSVFIAIVVRVIWYTRAILKGQQDGEN